MTLNKTSKKYLAILIVIISAFCFWFFYLRDFRDRSLVKEAEGIAAQVEEFKQSNGRLPVNLREMNLPEIESGPLYYEKENDSDYIIFYNTGFDETHTYYSNTKEWKVIYQ
jgi:hypothetical protein